MQEKPFLFPPVLCFAVGLAIPILFRSISPPLRPEYQTIANGLLSSVEFGLLSALVFWFAVVRKPTALFPVFCLITGEILGATGQSLFQGVDVFFAVVRIVVSLTLVGLAYGYFAKKIKKK